MTKRIPLAQRQLPNYSRGEERFHMLSHSLGVLLGLAALPLCLTAARDSYGQVSALIYSISLILLYTMSSIYHGLPLSMGKRVMQVMDHCTIYFLIAGTYTPILLCAIRPHSPLSAWLLLGFVWGFALLGCVFTAIDLKKYEKFSMVCYIGMGWCIVLAGKTALKALSADCLLLLLLGGIAYTVGAALYALGKKRPYIHGVFHVFVLLGSILHLAAVLQAMA